MIQQDSSPQRLIFAWYATSIDNTVAEIDIYLQAAYGLIRIAENTYEAENNDRALKLCKEIINKMNECKDSFFSLKSVYRELCNHSSPTEPIAEKLEKYEAFRLSVENNFEITKRCYNSIKRLLSQSTLRAIENNKDSVAQFSEFYKGDAAAVKITERPHCPDVASVDLYRNSNSNQDENYHPLSSGKITDQSQPKPPLRKSLPSRYNSSKSNATASAVNFQEAFSSTPMVSSNKKSIVFPESGYFSSNSNQIVDRQSSYFPEMNQPEMLGNAVDDARTFCINNSTKENDYADNPRCPRVSRKYRDSLRSSSCSNDGEIGQQRIPRVSRKCRENKDMQMHDAMFCRENECLGNRYNSYHIEFCKNLQDFVQDCITALQPYMIEHNLKTMQSLN